MKKTNIVLLDDHEIFLKGLENLLSNQGGLNLVGVFTEGHELLKAIHDLTIDLFLLDLQLADMTAEHLITSIKDIKPCTPILYLTMLRGVRIKRRIEKLGANGYILKDASVKKLLEAIEVVSGGKDFYYDEESEEEEKLNTVTFPVNKIQEILSKRELEILKLVCAEYSSAEIGEKLFLSTGTVDTHRRNILVKLGVNNTVGLVKFAIQNSLINDE
ncbi:response regulator transcription factor [Emticicia sp. BO119]|uniref:response regulator n=1 Tax=Emticicia sp. BO119 TaxID=2757768 RepID=UPI0015F113EB|nr:response regulator transcription factor [Emticicia sp. BO119]MBA4850019.1 response regulator transcription factor [Emticicia sp. BO119]